ncbi:MAG: PaaI family thioesterase [Rhodobacteraceae bacterium]|nr:PaaI family thioesterase [Paracoccaceae bacterium]
MNARRPEPVQIIKQRRDGLLRTLVEAIPFARHLGIVFDRRGDELTAIMPFDERLIGNPFLPALHGGATAAFLEVTATVGLTWADLWDDMEAGRLPPEVADGLGLPRLPKTIDFTVDYLRSGLPRDSYARARVARSGRRYASVQVEAWQDNRDRPHATARGAFLMPRRDPPPGP